MNTALPLPPPAQAWTPLPKGQWDEDAARHLLRRMGFAATPTATAEALRDGAVLAVRRALAKVGVLPKLDKLVQYDEDSDGVRAKVRGLSPEERQQFLNEIRRKGQRAFQDYAMQWLAFARQQENAAQEKFVLCLQDIFVIAAQKVRSPSRLFDHQQTLRTGLGSDYPSLTKAVLRSPGMIQYLDLNRSSRRAPNENFARELFELFTLGEGNYTENDVKEAARALTGVTLRNDTYRLDPQRHDNGDKTIFGQTGRWTPDELIDLIFRQPAAARFAPGEMVKFYLSDAGLPQPYLEEFGRIWAARGFKLFELANILFTSQIFYHPKFRGTMIKSPVQYYLGLCYDLNLDIPPYPGAVFNVLRTMGQPFFDPPNVRGWVGGRNWINSSTLAARRQIARGLFMPVNENNLNADDYRALLAARQAGRARLAITDDQFEFLAAQRTNAEIANHLITYFLPAPVSEEFRRAVESYIKDDPRQRVASIRQAAVCVLQSPLYQLC